MAKMEKEHSQPKFIEPYRYEKIFICWSRDLYSLFDVTWESSVVHLHITHFEHARPANDTIAIDNIFAILSS